MEQERRLTDSVLPDSEAASRLIIDCIPGIVLFMTPAGDLEFVNRPVTAYFGKTLEQLKHWWTDDTVHAEDRAHAHEVFTRATASGEPYKFEARFRRADGVYRWFQCRGLPHRDEAGRIVRWYAVGTDIEDRKRAEALLAGEKQLLEMVASDHPTSNVLETLCRHVESTAAGSYCSIVLVDRSGTTLQEAIAPSLAAEFNEAVRGWPLDRLGGPCQMAARDRQQVIMSDVASDMRWRNSWRALAQKHGLRSCWSTPMLSQSGKVMGTFALYQREPGTPTPFQLDVIRQYTHIASIAIERAQRDAAFRESEARRATAERDLQLMIDTIPVYVAAYEPDGTRSFVNQTWQQYMGLTVEEATGPNGRKTFPHFHPEDTERIDGAWRESLTSGRPLLTEARVRRADGQYRWHTSHRVPLRDEQGKIIRWYSVGVDIDNQKSAEDAVRRSEARLAVAERELQLTIDTIPTLVATYRPDGSRIFVNQTWRDYLGLRPDDAVDAFRTTVVHPEDAARVLEEWQRCLTSELPFSAEMRLRRADGVYRWHTVHRVLARDESGAVVKWYSVGVDIDEQKSSEERLRRSEARLAAAEYELQLTIDTLPTLVATYRPDGSRLFVNQTWLSYTGLSPDSAIKAERTDIVHPDDAARTAQEWQNSLATGVPFKAEVRLRRADGAYRWHSVHRVLARDETGAVAKWYSVGVDIEEQKRAEERLRESEYNSRLIADSIPGFIIIFTPDGNFEGVNRQTIEYFGKTLDDVTSKRWSTRDAIHPEDFPRCTELFKQSITSGNPFEFELRFRRSDGEYRWFQSRGLPLRDADGRIVRWYNLLIDIDERKRAEETARQSEARIVEAERELRLTLDSIPTMTWRAAPNGYVQSLNKRWFDYTGSTPEQSQHNGWRSFVHPDDLAELVDSGRRNIPAGRPVDVGARLRRFDGEYRWFMFRVEPVRDESGGIFAWYGAITDIEDRKLAEDALQQSQIRLAETERDLRIMLDSIPTITWRARSNGYVQYLNKKWFEYTGTTSDQVQGWRWKLCVHPDDLDPLVEAGNIYVTSGNPIDSEARLRRFDGEYRWFLFRPAPVRDEAGNVVAWYGTITDIEDRKQAEQKALEAERELQRMLDTIPAINVRGATNGYIQYFSKQWFEYTGTTLETAKGFRWWQSLHPDDKDRLVEFGARFVATTDPGDCEARLRRFDGVYRWFLFRPAPARNEAGEFIGWYGTVTDIEDRKRAEQKALEAEREVQRTIDNIPVLVGTYSAEGKRLSVNKWALEVTGLSADDMPDERWKKAFHPDELEAVDAQWRQCLARGEPFEREVRTRMADGTYRAHLTRRLPHRDASGKVIRWYGIAHDIEDQRRAEQALAASERKFKLITDTILALAWSARLDGSADFFNQRYIEYVGLPAEQLQDWGWTAAVHPDDLGRLAGVWQTIMASGQAGEAEARIRRHDGEYRWFLFRASPLRDEAGNIVKWYGINTDIEDRKQAEEALQRSEAMLAEGQRISSTGTFSWRVDTNEFTFSDEMCRIFEFDPNSAVTIEQIFSRIHPEDVPAHSERIRLVRAGGTTREGEVRLRMPDDRIKYLRSVGQMIHHQGGRPEYLGAVQDVTQRHLAESALDKVRSELAHVTRVMSLGALTASIAHEVNQPLAGIITNASTCLRMLAADPPNVDGARETARRTIRDGNRAANVITRLRSLFGRKGTATEILDLNEATREVVALVFSDLLRNRVIVRVELDDEPLLVTGDRVQLQQVILNLVRNASDAMSEVNDRPRNLLVTAGSEHDGSARLTVTDAGVGLHPQTAERLFDAFYTSKTDGMGIGLSVSRSIIESHGGKIWAETNDGPGATFSFSIPRQAADAGDEGTAGAILTRPTRGAQDQTRNA